MLIFEIHKPTIDKIFCSNLQRVYSHFKYNKNSFACEKDLNILILNITNLFALPQSYVFFII